jgi:hypothetical protein
MTPADTTTAFWLEAFTKCDRLDVLKLLFKDWRDRIAPRMTAAERQKVIAAKDVQKSQLLPKGKAA